MGDKPRAEEQLTGFSKVFALHIALPETDTRGAETFAERFRKLVEEMEIAVADQRIRITISVGITTYNPAEGIKSKSEIIHAADVALYQSKSAGKNRTKVVML